MFGTFPPAPGGSIGVEAVFYFIYLASVSAEIIGMVFPQPYRQDFAKN